MGDSEAPVPTVYRPPGYAVLVLLAQSLSNTEWFGLRVAQVLLSVLSAFALARAVGRWFPVAIRPTLWALSLNPFDAYFAGAMLSETLSATLVVAALVLVMLRPRGWMISAGAVLGIAALTRDQLILLPPFFALVLGWISWRPVRRRKSRLLVVLLLPLLAAAAVLPWTIRNAVQFNRLIPISAGRLGYNLWLGTWERDGLWNIGPVPVYPEYAFNDEAERKVVERFGAEMYTNAGDRAFIDLALMRFRAQPLYTVGVWLRRAPAMWFGTRTDLFRYGSGLPRGSPLWKAVKAFHWGLNFFIVVLGWTALRLAGRGRRLRLLVILLATPVLYTAIVYIPLHSTENRYSHPVLQCLVALAAINAVAAWSSFRNRWVQAKEVGRLAQ